MAGRPRRGRPCAFIDTHTMKGPISLDDVAKAHQADLGVDSHGRFSANRRPRRRGWRRRLRRLYLPRSEPAPFAVTGWTHRRAGVFDAMFETESATQDITARSSRPCS